MKTGMLANSRGQTLIQVMIAGAIAGIIIMTMVTAQTAMTRQAAQMSEKMASLDLQRTITMTLASPGACNLMLTDSPPAAFNPTSINAKTVPAMKFTKVPLSGTAGSPSVVAVSGTTPASPMSNTVFVKNIEIKDLACVPGPCSATSHAFSGNLTVELDQSRLVMALAPLKFPVTFSSTGGSGSQTLKTCNLANAGGAGAPGTTAGSPCTTSESVTTCTINGVTGPACNPLGPSQTTTYTMNGIVVTGGGPGGRCCLVANVNGIPVCNPF